MLTTHINLDKDQKPWLTAATHVLSGKYDGADQSTIQALQIGMRTISHPECQKALTKLALMKGRTYA